uniref:Carboxylic ester hydrolase n=1 Tax=Strongyloides papillosus TaxID=174720 RepID=A0A0N5CDL2_STREA
MKVLGQKITEYLGVPYAYPPIGAYRFKPPQTLDRKYWNGTYFAVELPPACPQIIRTMGFSGYDDLNPKSVDENCLKFNMWVPKSNKKKPIIVFLHGGSWTVRTASTDKFNGSVLALKTNTIVITPNFRLGFFGFAYLGNGSKISGNMGLLDQQMVLKWINKNIDKFGGDKKKVTIFGTSSGASSVAAHLFSKGSRPYFNRGIMSSGTITHFMSTVSTKIAETNTRNVSRLVKCTSETNKTINNDNDILECLINKNFTELLEAASKVKADDQMPTPFPFMPVDSDNIFFKGSIKEMYSKKLFNKDVDLMLGRTGDEATFFMATGFTNNSKYGCYFYPHKPVTDPDNACTMNKTNFYSLVLLGGNIIGFNKTETEKLAIVYNNSATTYTNKSIRILSDFIFDCELCKFAKIYASVSLRNVYFYEYARRSPINVWPSWTGAMHGDDLIDIFGIPFRHPEKYDKYILKNEKHYSEHVMWAIGNFSKRGNPTVKWQKLTSEKSKALIFNGTLSFDKNLLHKNVTLSTCNEFFKVLSQYISRKMNEKNKSIPINTTKGRYLVSVMKYSNNFIQLEHEIIPTNFKDYLILFNKIGSLVMNE